MTDIFNLVRILKKRIYANSIPLSPKEIVVFGKLAENSIFYDHIAKIINLQHIERRIREITVEEDTIIPNSTEEVQIPEPEIIKSPKPEVIIIPKPEVIKIPKPEVIEISKPEEKRRKSE